jgi:Flp pilus assembly protein TadD
MLDCQLFGLDPAAHHLMNVLWHAANSCLALLLLYQLTNSLWTSAFAAALFAWHPLRVESVAWASERKDVLSTFFFLLTLLAYIRYVRETSTPLQEQEPETKGGDPKRKIDLPQVRHPLRFYSVALCLFALGLMSKPMLVTTPFVLLLLDYWPLRRFDFSRKGSNPAAWKRLLWEKTPFFAIAIASSVVTLLVQEEAVVPTETYSVGLRPVTLVLGYGGYLGKTFWPVNLALIYPFPRYLPWFRLISSAIALAVISVVCWRTRRTRPHLLVGWLWFLGTLVPVIGLIQFGGAVMADRYTYVPHIGLFLALACEGRLWVQRWHSPRSVPVIASTMVLAACVVLTSRQLRYWRDGVSLFTHTVEVTTENPVAELNLAISLDVKGASDEALKRYQEALRLNPQLQEAHTALGDLLNELGRTDEAITNYYAELKIHEQPVTHENLGVLLVKHGRIDEAMEHYESAARLDPRDARPHYLMAKALLRQGRSGDAVAQFREALRLDSNNVQALVYLARVLAADRDARVRNGAEAVSLAERANALSGNSQSFMLDTLAMAYAEAGHFGEAEQTLNQALERATAGHETDALAAIQARLKLYQSRQPYREDFTAQAGARSSAP